MLPMRERRILGYRALIPGCGIARGLLEDLSLDLCRRDQVYLPAYFTSHA
jgi:hypothetical protein